MRKTWLGSDQICVAMGHSTALNLMFETKGDHEQFFKLWKRYLGDMASLLHYHLTPTGWILLFKTRSKTKIIEAYQDLRKNSKKAKKECELHDESRILSEHFRIFLSQFVRKTNARKGRKGTLVLSRFSKYILDETSDYEDIFKMLTKQYKNQPQKKKKYQAKEADYDVETEMQKNNIWKVATRMYKGLENGFRERFGVVLMHPKSNVLRNFYLSKKSNKIPPPST